MRLLFSHDNHTDSRAARAIAQQCQTELARNPPVAAPVLSAEELLHEIQVRQIALEMQNEAQLLAWEALDRQSEFVAQVRQVLTQTGANPTLLKIKLTESLMIDNVDDAIARMHALKALGIRFSMDDFGTGFSSLSYLKRLPLDQLKIDRSFIRDISSDPRDAAIVHTIITMGKDLGLHVLAEGVETESQLVCLSAHGCISYQGYLFARPLPRTAFENFVQCSNNLAATSVNDVAVCGSEVTRAGSPL